MEIVDMDESSPVLDTPPGTPEPSRHHSFRDNNNTSAAFSSNNTNQDKAGQYYFPELKKQKIGQIDPFVRPLHCCELIKSLIHENDDCLPSWTKTIDKQFDDLENIFFVNLFGCQFSVANILNDPKEVFHMARMTYSAMSLQAGPSEETSENYDQLYNFCQLVARLIGYCLAKKRIDRLHCIYFEMRHFVCSTVGLLRHSLTKYFCDFSVKYLDSRLHAAILLWTTALQIFSLPRKSQENDFVCSFNILDLDDDIKMDIIQQTSLVVIDGLLILAANSSDGQSFFDRNKCSSCQCCCDVWLMLFRINNGFFWRILARVFKLLQHSPVIENETQIYKSSVLFDERSLSNDGRVSMNCAEMQQFFWNTTFWLSQLFSQELPDILAEKATSRCISWMFCQETLMTAATLDRNTINTKVVWHTLNRYFQLCTLVEPSQGWETVVQKLWETAISQRLNDGSSTFTGDDKILGADTSLDLIKQISSYVNRIALPNPNWSIWQMFVRALAVISSNDQLWQKVRPRIYAKLPLSKLRELSSVGLKNVIALLLTVGYVNDRGGTDSQLLNNVLPACIDLSNVTASFSLERCKIYQRTLTALLLMRIQSSTAEWKPVCLKLHQYFVFVSKQMENSMLTKDAALLIKDYLVDTISSLISCEHFECEPLVNLLRPPIIDETLRKLCKTSCRLDSVFHVLIDLVNLMENKPEKSCEAVIKTLERNFCPVILNSWQNDQLNGENCALLLGKIIARCMKSGEKEEKEHYQQRLGTILQEYCLAVSTRPPVFEQRLVFLNCLLRGGAVFCCTQKTTITCQSYHITIISVWLSLVFLTDPANDTTMSDLDSVSTELLNHCLFDPSIRLQQSDNIVADVAQVSPSHALAANLFTELGKLGERQQQQQNIGKFNSARQLLEQYIGKCLPILETELSGRTDSGRYVQTFHLLGHLLQSCARLLHPPNESINKSLFVRITKNLLEKQWLCSEGNRDVRYAVCGLLTGLRQLPSQTGFFKRLIGEIYLFFCDDPQLIPYLQWNLTKQPLDEHFVSAVCSKGVEQFSNLRDKALTKSVAFISLVCEAMCTCCDDQIRQRIANELSNALSSSAARQTFVRNRKTLLEHDKWRTISNSLLAISNAEEVQELRSRIEAFRKE